MSTSSKHRSTMGDLPTLPQMLGSLVLPLVMMRRLPTAVQHMALVMLVEQVTATAVQVQMQVQPKPVV